MLLSKHLNSVPTGRTAIILVLSLYALLFLSLAAAQAPNTPNTILPASLPACAQTCGVLQQAQSACLPPAAPATGPNSYQVCFCQSGYLTALRAGTGSVPNLCAPQCADADFQSIAQWYTGYCQQSGQGSGSAGGAAPNGADSAAAPTTTAAGAAASTAAADATQQFSGDNTTAASTGAGWFSTHWRWVVMLIVLFVAFTAIGVGGALLYRRHKRRHGAERFFGSGSDLGPLGGRDSPPGLGPNPPPPSGAAHPELGLWARGMSSVHDVRDVPMAYYLDDKMTERGTSTEPWMIGDGKKTAGHSEGRPTKTDDVVGERAPEGAKGGGALGRAWSKRGSRRLEKK